MSFVFNELTYKNAGISVALAHVLLALLVVFCAFNFSRKAEPILMMAQIIDRESVAITPSVHVQPKDKKLDKEKTTKDSDLVKEKTSEAKQDGALASAPVSMPNSDASELNNPKPPYPAISRKLREQGLVLLRACIGANGSLESLDLKQGSGYLRLDQVALQTVKQWRFIPAKKGNTPIPMCYELPVKFILE
ncbi:energy transducer TonB [Polynucleobacter sp. MWH-Aus1W21]|jgi:protein TonB|uniref:energy transducer TonB n=1 Tax=Polynucleobacter sp. MWH-Aus1W21 TaxID=1855880 RepID=UPI001BFD6789|nr:energy transducer TonB [Polynucleobacter sp. MWH-Aus1W21]QWD65514.1 energy transducer TonB [Polynucleobacter sp. MWH-Aus1W21]